jgi:hypothetical protein
MAAKAGTVLGMAGLTIWAAPTVVVAPFFANARFSASGITAGNLNPHFSSPAVK